MVTIIVLASAAIIFAVSLYLALCRDYEDGILGNFALGGMAMASTPTLYETIAPMFGAAGSKYEFLPTTALLYAAVALFMVRHAYRFRRWTKTGKGEWRDDGQKKRNRTD